MSLGYTFVLTALLMDSGREQSWILHAKTRSFWYTLQICCGLACYLRSVYLCHQWVCQGNRPKQKLSVLQRADCMLEWPKLQKSCGTRDMNSAGCWVVKHSSMLVLGCRLCLDMWLSFYWYIDGHTDEKNPKPTTFC